MGNEELNAGFLVLDDKPKLLMFNSEAVKILTYPTISQKIKCLDTFLTDRICKGLVTGHSGAGLTFTHEFKSGNRRYVCRAFELSVNALTAQTNGTSQQTKVLLLERNLSRVNALSSASRLFGFTLRENQTVELLLQGLTSKEIASRLGIRPNTVQAFVRMVMVKMGVTTRSGIVGKLFVSQS
ncbi:MAG: transcriptional regulator, LuxR family [Acidobacteriaceae bacterium]|nr:transcriptional regulator, LuxR family [Acidobacteriaceae bacterium]